jgi:hypothetical protein
MNRFPPFFDRFPMPVVFAALAAAIGRCRVTFFSFFKG